MNDFFQVDLDALQRFITSLRDSGQQMDSAMKSMKSMDAGKIGTDELDRAAEEFQDTWQYGLGQLKEKIKVTNDGVHAAQRKYQEVEQQAMESLAKVNESGGQ